MLSFVAALLQADPQAHDSEAKMQERARDVFLVADTNKNGELTKLQMNNYFADFRVCIDVSLAKALHKVGYPCICQQCR